MEVYIVVSDKDKRNAFKKLIQDLTKQKSVKINKSGMIDITFRFKPNQLSTDIAACQQLESDLLKKIYAVTKIKYKAIAVQKQPVFCYNIYERIINISSEHSRDKSKRFLSYFKKDESGSFVKTSYAEVNFQVQPISAEDFKNFLITLD